MQRSEVYPHIVYHPDGSHRIVKTAEERDALGKGWRDLPYPAPEPKVEGDPLAVLATIVDELSERVAALEAAADKKKK